MSEFPSDEAVKALNEAIYGGLKGCGQWDGREALVAAYAVNLLAICRAEREALRARIEELLNDMALEFTANIPLLPPDPRHDPNDEFKRCAVDRKRRVDKYIAEIRATLSTKGEQ